MPGLTRILSLRPTIKSILLIIFGMTITWTAISYKRYSIEPTSPKVAISNQPIETVTVPKKEQIKVLDIQKYIDIDFMKSNFSKLVKSVVDAPTGGLKAEVKRQMMKYRNLDLDTNHWFIHRQSGKTLTWDQLFELAPQTAALPVPNLAHFILPFQVPELKFHHYIAALSVFWVMKADLVVFWYVKPPTGKYWDMLMKNVTLDVWENKVVMIRRHLPKTIYGQKLEVKEHAADVMRIEAILLVGGVYFDLDVLALKPMYDLRKFNFTIGKELPSVLCNGVFMANRFNTILALWHLGYQTFEDKSWGGHSLYLITALCKQFKDMCHIEEESLDRPGWVNFDKMFGKRRDWKWERDNYAIHLFYRLHNVNYDMESVKYADHAVGDIFRFILFGNKTLQVKPEIKKDNKLK